MFNKYKCVTCAPSMHSSPNFTRDGRIHFRTTPVRTRTSQPMLNACAKGKRLELFQFHYSKLARIHKAGCHATFSKHTPTHPTSFRAHFMNLSRRTRRSGWLCDWCVFWGWVGQQFNVNCRYTLIDGCC